MKSLKESKSTFNLFYLIVCIIWTPLQYFYLHVDGAGRTIMVLSLIAIVLNIGKQRNEKDIFYSPAFVCWTILVLYSFINSMVKGYVEEKGFLIFTRNNFIDAYVFLWITMIELRRDKDRCLMVILVAQLMYMFMGMLHISSFQFERGGAEGLGNALPILSASSIFVASLLFIDGKLKGGWWTFGVVLAIALYVTIVCATRKALGAIVIILVGFVLGRSNKMNIRSIIVLVIVVLVMAQGIQWIMSNTIMGERLTDIGTQYNYQLVSNPVVNEFLLNLLGDRSFFYYYGVILYQQHPVTGIGLCNFMQVQQSPVRIHSEYIVQLCENGLVGFVLLMLFYIMLFVGLFRKGRRGENIIFYLFALYTVLFLNLTAWTYNSDVVMLFYAVLITEVYSPNTKRLTTSNTTIQHNL